MSKKTHRMTPGQHQRFGKEIEKFRVLLIHEICDELQVAYPKASREMRAAMAVEKALAPRKP